MGGGGPRGTRGQPFPWGDQLEPDGSHQMNVFQGEFPGGNTGADGYLGTAPVDAFSPNGYGLYNMCGNVWEWCSDWLGLEYYRTSPLRAPAGPTTGTSRSSAAVPTCATRPTAAATACQPASGLNQTAPAPTSGSGWRWMPTGGGRRISPREGDGYRSRDCQGGEVTTLEAPSAEAGSPAQHLTPSERSALGKAAGPSNAFFLCPLLRSVQLLRRTHYCSPVLCRLAPLTQNFIVHPARRIFRR